MNLTDPTFQQFFNRITDISELERLHNISREERIVEIIQGGISRAAARILDDSVFTEIEGTPLYELYFYANTQNVPQNTIDKIMAALTRRNLKEEIEKRLLNTCLDSCPACLLTSCEIESPLRSQLILSRRLLRLVIRHLKTERAVCVEPSDTSHLLTEKLKQLLATHFQGYVVYSANKSEQVSEAISELMMNGIQVNGKNYPVKINSTGYREFDLEKKTVKYEIGLRCVES